MKTLTSGAKKTRPVCSVSFAPNIVVGEFLDRDAGSNLNSIFCYPGTCEAVLRGLGAGLKQFPGGDKPLPYGLFLISKIH